MSSKAKKSPTATGGGVATGTGGGAAGALPLVLSGKGTFRQFKLTVSKLQQNIFFFHKI